MKFLFFTNDMTEIQQAYKAGIDRIVIDLERTGKSERQHGYHLEINNHSLNDIIKIKNIFPDIEIVCRVNPVSRYEIEQAIDFGANYIMLPMFRTITEVELLLKYSNNKAKTILLFETPEAIAISKQLSDYPIDECMLGLNDLSIGYNKKFIFEFLLNNFIDNIRDTFHEKPFGFAGITILDSGMPLATRYIIQELARTNSVLTIIRRAFKKDIVDRKYDIEIKKLKRYYRLMKQRTTMQKEIDRTNNISRIIEIRKNMFK